MSEEPVQYGIYSRKLPERDEFLITSLEPDIVLQCQMLSARWNMSSWDFFGWLWKKTQEQEWWSEFLIDCLDGNSFSIEIQFIHPDKFADAVYSYLKERQ